MGRINMGRVILGGIVAGIVADVLGYIVDGVILAPQWAEGMKALGRTDFSVSQIVGFNILGLAYGVFANVVVCGDSSTLRRGAKGRRVRRTGGVGRWSAAA